MRDFFTKFFRFCKDHFYIGLCHPAQHAFIFVFGRTGLITSLVKFRSVVTAREAVDMLHKEDFTNA